MQKYTYLQKFIFMSSLLFNSVTKADDMDKFEKIGPTEPIGHSLKRNPELQKKIENLIIEEKKTMINSLSSSDIKSNLAINNFNTPIHEILEIPKAFVNLNKSYNSYAIVVEKLHHRLSLFKITENNSYKLVKVYRAITGKNIEDKTTKGDLRTPEGIYFITGKKFGKELPSKYGPLALTLDYPNIYDIRKQKSGHGIWLHSTNDPERLLRPYDTEGCVALSPSDILDLSKYIELFETPVVITKKMILVNPKEQEEPKIKALEMIEGWRDAWEQSDLKHYMNYYSNNFISLKKTKQQWENYKTKLSQRRLGNINIKLDEPKILAFEDQLLVVFMQNYSSPEHNDFGRKFLYLQWENDRYRIIAEKWYPNKNINITSKNDDNL